MQGANFDKVLVDTWNDSVRKYKKRKRDIYLREFPRFRVRFMMMMG